MNTLSPLFLLSVVAVVLAGTVIALHFWNRHRWDAETARLKARGLPWIVLLILTVPVVFWLALLAGAQLGHRSGAVGLLIVLLVVIFSRRISAAKKLGR